MNQADAMAAFGVGSKATWVKWAEAGMPRTRMGRGYTYDADEIRAWLEANPQPGHGGDRTLDFEDDLSADAAQDLYRKERALKTAAERELRELKLAEERGELVRREEVDATWKRVALRIRTAVMEIADQVMPEVQAASTPLEIEDAIRTGCRRALETLADG